MGGETHQLLPPQVEGRECYPTAGDWLSNAGVQGVKGDKLLAESGDASNGWLWSGCSTLDTGLSPSSALVVSAPIPTFPAPFAG